MSARTLVVQSIACDSVEEMRKACRAADPRADVVELRIDLLKDLEGPAALDRLMDPQGKPKLVTVRSRPQGGGAHPAEREPLLRRALQAGVAYLDLEYGDHDLPLLHGGPVRTRRILSHHDLAGTPADLRALFSAMRAAAPGALLKIVTTADAVSDNLRVRDLLKGADPGSLAAFCMGPKGVMSRVLAPAWGTAAVFAALRGAAPTAPGQVALEDLFDLYRFDAIGPRTRLLGVLGFPVTHSLSPLLHNAALAALDLDYRYLPFEAETLGEFLPLWSEVPLAGLSVTLPHKESILPHLDAVDETARGVGAVNTVVKRWNRLEGHNTDVDAALAPLRPILSLPGAHAAILGAGGAARAVAYGLVREGARVTVFNRTAARGRSLARAHGARSLPWGRLRGFRCDVLVNTTSVGLAPDVDRTPVPGSWVKTPIVYDIIYNPPVTRLLREAAARGARTLGGLDMFVGQAEAQFRLFTGKEPPEGLMGAALRQAMAARPPDPAPTPGGARRRRSSAGTRSAD